MAVITHERQLTACRHLLGSAPPQTHRLLNRLCRSFLGKGMFSVWVVPSSVGAHCRHLRWEMEYQQEQLNGPDCQTKQKDSYFSSQWGGLRCLLLLSQSTCCLCEWQAAPGQAGGEAQASPCCPPSPPALGECKEHLFTLVEDPEPTKGARGMEHSRMTVEFLCPFSSPYETWDEFLFLAKHRGSLAMCRIPDSPWGSEERSAATTLQPFCRDV